VFSGLRLLLLEEINAIEQLQTFRKSWSALGACSDSQARGLKFFEYVFGTQVRYDDLHILALYIYHAMNLNSGKHRIAGKVILAACDHNTFWWTLIKLILGPSKVLAINDIS